MIYLRMEFHEHNSNKPLVTAMKPKAKYGFHVAIILFYSVASESTSGPYLSSDRRLSAKLVPTFCG
jgi:hypothetical protein